MATIDTLQDAVNTLTSSTTSLLDEVSTSKTYLDAAKDSAEDARDTALTHKTGAETAKTGAEAARDLAYSYQQSAASAVAYQDLAAIAESKTDTAVDVFVYDTRKDSDGGAWRKRTQHTSWYNETLNTSTRGSRKEFPAVAVIVAENNQVTIYDGDDPSLPMWMVFNQNITSTALIRSSNISSVAALNGVVAFTGADNTSGLIQAHFIEDHATKIRNSAQAGGGNETQKFGPLVDRNENVYGVGGSNKYILVSTIANDVAMTVLPNAPIDSATGLPVPTIAVATEGGVSVIKDDGTVVHITGTVSYTTKDVQYSNSVAISNGTRSIDIADDRLFFTVEHTTAPGDVVLVYSLPALDYVEAWGKGYSNSAEEVVAISNTSNAYRGLNNTNSYGYGVHYNSGDLFSVITSSYNTGWMNGDIKLATLSDTDDTDVTGTELVTNGTFDTDLSGWTDESTGTGTVSVVSGEAALVRADINNRGIIEQTLTMVSGKKYLISVEKVSGSAISIGLGTSSLGFEKLLDTLSSGINTYTVEALSSTMYLNFRGTSDGTGYIDNISVRLAEEDRSVNGNGLQVFGTVTKNPVATGADLVAYSGFTGSNYLYQPYTSDLDFGLGEASMMCWFKGTDGYGIFIDRKNEVTNTGRITLGTYPYGGVNTAYGGFNGANIYGTVNVDDNNWHHVVVLRKPAVGLEIYIDGKLSATSSAAANSNIDGSAENTYTKIGVRNDGAQNYSGKIALLRLSATNPSAEQIAKIYEDEKVLFQEGAQATLYGSSDAVTALAYDDDTNLLHVGTSSGRSDFQGLRRVSNTTDAVGAAISASNGLIAED